MASRRKSSTPCMVPPREEPEGEGGAEEDWGAWSVSSDGCEEAEPLLDSAHPAAAGGYECKYCSFQTARLNLFTAHVDAEHPDVVLNASYVCLECDYHTKSYDPLLAHNARLHRGEDRFRWTMVRRNNETIFQQTVNDSAFGGGSVKVEEEEQEVMEEGQTEEEEEPQQHQEEEPQEEARAPCGIAVSKTPIMRGRSRPELKKAPPPLESPSPADRIIKLESDEDEAPPTLSPAPIGPAPSRTPCLVPVSAPLQVVPQSLVVGGPTLLQVKGGGIGGGGVLPAGALAQVLTALQNQNQNQNQLLIPVSSIPAYHSSMDSNLLLLSAYSRFPYPSLSEILGLSSQTKFSEEQIKVWFSAQRLKGGVSWTPEEVEEARRKKFNGTVQSVQQTITVIPANMAAAGLQSIFQTCQIVGQPGLVLTQVGGATPAVPVATPITLTVGGVPGQPKAAEPPAAAAQTEVVASSSAAALGAESAATSGKPKKSKEQLAELKASYGRRQFATEAEISRLMAVTRLSKRAIKKWFSDTRYNQRNSRDHQAPPPEVSANRAASGGRAARSSGPSDPAVTPPTSQTPAAIVIDSSDDAAESSPPSGAPGADSRGKLRHAFPDFTPQRFKEKTAEQRRALEASFLRADTPSDEELSRLRAQTKLTRREVDAWFTERRKNAPRGGEEAGEDGQELPPPSSVAPGGRRAVKRTAEQLNVLKTTFMKTQWPTAEEYDHMAAASGLPRPYVVSWFGDTRYAWKNNSLKWCYLYQVDEALNGGTKTQKKSRKRFRGWSRRPRRNLSRASPQGGATPTTTTASRGSALLQDYFLRNGGFLSEGDLDDLVNKSSLSYQQVRDWFQDARRRAQEGAGPEEGEGSASQHLDSDGEMEVKEGGEEEKEEEEEVRGAEAEPVAVDQSQRPEQT